MYSLKDIFHAHTASSLSGRDQTLITEGTVKLVTTKIGFVYTVFVLRYLGFLYVLPISTGVSRFLLAWAGFFGWGRGHRPMDHQQLGTVTCLVLLLKCRWSCHQPEKRPRCQCDESLLLRSLSSDPRGILVPLLSNKYLEMQTLLVIVSLSTKRSVGEREPWPPLTHSRPDGHRR